MLKLREYQNLKQILGRPKRSKRQLNGLFQSDCEILQLGRGAKSPLPVARAKKTSSGRQSDSRAHDDAGKFLATSVDSLGEEISIGLYKNPATWAWMCISSSVGDLAASGTSALGITVSTQWKFGTSLALQKKFYRELNKACQAMNVDLLGGDSGHAKDHVFTSSILGASSMRPLSRVGARAGDFIVLAHRKDLGIGPALAFSFLNLGRPSTSLKARPLLGLQNKLNTKAWHRKLEPSFRPRPSWQLSAEIHPYANAAMDTSDGLMTSLLILSELNQLGFLLQWQPEILHPLAKKFCLSAGIHPLTLWFGDLGDGQILYSVSEKNLKQVLKLAAGKSGHNGKSARSKLGKNRLDQGLTELAILGQFQKTKNFHLAVENPDLSASEKGFDLPLHVLNKMPKNAAGYRKFWKKLSDRFHKEIPELSLSNG